MCDIWKYPSDDKKGEELSIILGHSYLRNVESFGITGGEPFVRKDLIDVVRYAIDGMPALRQISITTNGFNTARIRKYVAAMLECTRPAGVKLSITVSVDGVGDLHSHVRGVPGVWSKVESTLLMLKSLYDEEIELRVAATITRENAQYTALCELQDYMGRLGVPIIFRMAVFVERIFNERLISVNGVLGGDDARNELKRFIEERLIEGFSPRRQYYEMIRSVLVGDISSRNIKCMEMRDGGMLDSNGSLYVCSVSGEKIGSLLEDDALGLRERAVQSREAVRCNNCNKCYHDHQSHNPLLRTIARVFSSE